MMASLSVVSVCLLPFSFRTLTVCTAPENLSHCEGRHPLKQADVFLSNCAEIHNIMMQLLYCLYTLAKQDATFSIRKNTSVQCKSVACIGPPKRIVIHIL